MEYFVGNRNIYLFSIGKEKVELLSFPKNSEYENSVTELRKSLTDISGLKDNNLALGQFKKFTVNAYSVYKNYVQKGIPADTKELIVISEGLFNYIPFDVLLTEKFLNKSLIYQKKKK